MIYPDDEPYPTRWVCKADDCGESFTLGREDRKCPVCGCTELTQIPFGDDDADVPR